MQRRAGTMAVPTACVSAAGRREGDRSRSKQDCESFDGTGHDLLHPETRQTRRLSAFDLRRPRPGLTPCRVGPLARLVSFKRRRVHGFTEIERTSPRGQQLILFTASLLGHFDVGSEPSDHAAILLRDRASLMPGTAGFG